MPLTAAEQTRANMRGMVVKRAVRRNGILWEWKSRAHLVFGGLSFTPGFSPVFDGGGGKTVSTVWPRRGLHHDPKMVKTVLALSAHTSPG